MILVWLLKSFIPLSLFVINMKTPIKYFLYARKSTEGEDRQVTSIEDQISEMKKLAQELNIEIVDIISESKSAKAQGREQFNRMLQRIKGGEARGILCWKLNRLARNPWDGAEIIGNLQQGIIQHIQTYGREYKPTDNVIMMYVEFGMSNQYVNDLSVDVKRGMRKKAERGWYPAMQLPLGYIHNPKIAQTNNQNEIIVDTNNFKIIKKLWKLLLTGMYSIADIKREGDAFGLTSRKGNLYSQSSYYKMFSCEFYCGYYYWKNENNERTRYLGNHKPMVTELEYKKVQKILQRDKKLPQKQKYFFPFKGVISCGECNGFVTCENKLQAICTHCKFKFSLKTKSICPKCKTDIAEMENPSIIDKTYYHCTKKVTTCTQGGITDVEAEKHINNYLQKISINQDFFDFAINGLKTLNDNATIKDNKIIASLKKRQTELKQRSQRLIEMRVDGEINKEQLQEMQQSNTTALEEIEYKILSLKDININWFKAAKEQLKFSLTCKEMFEKGDEKVKKMIASKLGSNLILKDKSLYFIRLDRHLGIKECSIAYDKEKDRVEPEISIENIGDINHFDTLFPVLRSELKQLRTCFTDNLKDNLA